MSRLIGSSCAGRSQLHSARRSGNANAKEIGRRALASRHIRRILRSSSRPSMVPIASINDLSIASSTNVDHEWGHRKAMSVVRNGAHLITIARPPPRSFNNSKTAHRQHLRSLDIRRTWITRPFDRARQRPETAQATRWLPEMLLGTHSCFLYQPAVC